MTGTEEPAELIELKRALRRDMDARLRLLSAAELDAAGARAAAAIGELISAHTNAGPIALFAGRPFEINTQHLDDAVRASGRVRLLPAIVGDTLIFRAVPAELAARELPVDRLGIPTPPPALPAVPLAAAAVVVVPACALDLRGRRLGWGKGYYDRALAPRRHDGRARGTIALVLDAQLVEEVPAGPHDVMVERLFTPERGLLDVVP